MTEVSLLPINTPAAGGARPPAKLVRLSRRRDAGRRAPRRALGAPGSLPVRAAAERLGLRPRSVRYLIEQGRLRSQRLGRMHFLPTAQVEAYRRARRARRRAYLSS